MSPPLAGKLPDEQGDVLTTTATSASETNAPKPNLIILSRAYGKPVNDSGIDLSVPVIPRRVFDLSLNLEKAIRGEDGDAAAGEYNLRRPVYRALKDRARAAKSP